MISPIIFSKAWIWYQDLPENMTRKNGFPTTSTTTTRCNRTKMQHLMTGHTFIDWLLHRIKTTDIVVHSGVWWRTRRHRLNQHKHGELLLLLLSQNSVRYRTKDYQRSMLTRYACIISATLPSNVLLFQICDTPWHRGTDGSKMPKVKRYFGK